MNVAIKFAGTFRKRKKMRWCPTITSELVVFVNGGRRAHVCVNSHTPCIHRINQVTLNLLTTHCCLTMEGLASTLKIFIELFDLKTQFEWLLQLLNLVIQVSVSERLQNSDL